MEIYDEQLMNYDGICCGTVEHVDFLKTSKKTCPAKQHSANLILFEGHRCFSVGVAAAASK